MTLNVYPDQGSQVRLALESAYGTLPGSPAWRRLKGVGITLSPDGEINPFMPRGSMVPTLPMVDDKLTTGSFEGVIDFNGITYPLYSVLGFPTFTSLGGGPAAYQRVWTWDGRGRLNAASWSVDSGFPDKADRALGVIFNSMELSGGRPDGFSISGDLFGKPMTAGNLMGGVTLERQTITPTGTISGGTFSLTFNGFTASGIAFNATAAAVQTALEGLPNIEPGDVVVGGGPANTTPLTVDFSGSYAGTDVPAMTVDNSLLTGTTPVLTVTTTTPGADAVTDIVPVPAGAILGNAYLDTTWAGRHTTQVGYALGMGVTFGERLQRVTPINKSQTTDTRIDVGDQDHNLSLTLAQNAVADAQLAKFYAGTWSYPSVEWIGDVISGANSYMLRIDASVFYTEISEPGEVQGAQTRDYTGRMGSDPTTGNVFSVTLVNTVSGTL